MEHLPKKIHQNGISYTLVGDYYIPDLKLPEESRPIGRWGRMHKAFLQEHRPGQYNVLLLSGKLWTYLADLNEQAADRLACIILQMRVAEGVTEELKARDPLLRDAIRLNLLTDRVDIVRDLGWRRNTSALTDTDVKYLFLYFEQNYGLTSEKKMTAALSIVANENCYHPIQDVLNSLVWDGTPRIRSCLHHFLGADESDYVEETLCLVGGQGGWEPALPAGHDLPGECGGSHFGGRGRLQSLSFAGLGGGHDDLPQRPLLHEIQQIHPAPTGGGAEGFHAVGHRGRSDTGLSGTLHRQHGLLQTAVQGGAGPHL